MGGGGEKESNRIMCHESKMEATRPNRGTIGREESGEEGEGRKGRRSVEGSLRHHIELKNDV